jgi:integrase
MPELDQPFTDLLTVYETEYLKFQGRESRVNGHRLQHLAASLGTFTVLTTENVDRFFHSLAHCQPSTRNRYRSLLSHVLKWGGQRGHVKGDLPPDFLRHESEHNERTRRLAEEEESRLTQHMSDDLRLLFHAALDTGLRYGALTQLTWKDYQGGVLVVPARTQKQRQSQRIPLTNRIKRVLDAKSDRALPKDTLFPVDHFRSRWDRARQSAGVQDLHWHDLRGEFASRLSEREVRVEVVSRLLGHASLTTTQRYLRPRVSDFEEAIGKLGV